MKIFKQTGLLFLTFFFVLTGCQTPAIYNQTTDNIAVTQQRSHAAFAESNKAGVIPPPLLVNQGLYVDKTPISLSKEPGWLKRPIILHGEGLPFSYFSRTIVGNTGRTILIHYQVGLNATTNTSMNYSGTIKGALDILAAKTGYVYTVNGNHIYWQAFVTKTFDVAFMPGGTDYMMGKAGGGTSSGAGGGTSGTTTGIIDDSASSQYSSLKGTLSVWKDLETTVKELLTTDGKVVVSEATTSVTVRDKPSNVALVANYIANLNSSLAKQVLVKVEILQVQLESDFNYGINWSIVENAFGGSQLVLNANYGTPVSIISLTGAPTPTGGLQINNHTTGVTLLINALKQQGRVAVVTEPRVVCLNNQVSALRIVNQNGYLASVQNTSFGGGSTTGNSTGNSVTSQITPGTLVTGLTLYVLPKIMGNKVLMQVNADITNNLGFQDISSGGATPTTIQVPNVTQKQFNQRSVIGSGDTLILAGFKQIQNQSGAMQLLDSQALGGKAAQQLNVETIILITPIILNGYV